MLLNARKTVETPSSRSFSFCLRKVWEETAIDHLEDANELMLSTNANSIRTSSWLIDLKLFRANYESFFGSLVNLVKLIEFEAGVW